MADRNRMNREVHVLFCGGLEVRFLRSTRLKTLQHSTIRIVAIALQIVLITGKTDFMVVMHANISESDMSPRQYSMTVQKG